MDPALELARLAGRAALVRYRGTIQVDYKADASPVTDADRAAERAARDWLATRFPDDGILGEEFGETSGTSGREWLIDPIDGTRAFVHGIPLWGSLVALVEQGTVLAGAAVYPALGEELVAAPAGGCWHQGRRARVSDVAALDEATVCTTSNRFADPAKRDGWDRVCTRASEARTWGDCVGYLLVATGRAEVMLDPVMNPWDAACMLPIIEEAGGVFTTWSGKRSALGPDSVATNAALAVTIRTILAGET